MTEIEYPIYLKESILFYKLWRNSLHKQFIPFLFTKSVDLLSYYFAYKTPGVLPLIRNTGCCKAIRWDEDAKRIARILRFE
jgi:hypothetical protein